MGNLKIIAPSRMHDYFAEGGYFSSGNMVDAISLAGFDGIDVSLENLSRFDEAARAVLYNIAKRAAEKNISLCATHLSFYMPDPDSEEFNSKYIPELKCGIDATSFLGIKYAVIHPVAYHSKRKTLEEWLIKNVEFLAPLVEYANSRGVELLIENMASHNESDGDHLFGSTGLEIYLLAKIFGCGNCWDTGHANISGLCQSNEISAMSDTLRLVHIHDNNGMVDDHRLPLDDGCTVDWSDVCSALGKIGYNGDIEMEIKTSHMPRSADARMNLYRLALMRGEGIKERILREK